MYGRINLFYSRDGPPASNDMRVDTLPRGEISVGGGDMTVDQSHSMNVSTP